MRKNPHEKILKLKPKKQHLSIIPKSCPIYIYIYISPNLVGKIYMLLFLEINDIYFLMKFSISSPFNSWK